MSYFQIEQLRALQESIAAVANQLADMAKAVPDSNQAPGVSLVAADLRVASRSCNAAREYINAAIATLDRAGEPQS
jgi:hypothetical protein